MGREREGNREVWGSRFGVARCVERAEGLEALEEPKRPCDRRCDCWRFCCSVRPIYTNGAFSCFPMPPIIYY